MTDLIKRLRKCAEELSRIADAMAKQMSVTSTIDAEDVERVIARYSATGHYQTAPAIVRYSSDGLETDDDCSDRDSLDELVEKAKDVIRETKRASGAHFQRQLGWGYKKAAKVVDELENRGIIGPARTGASREVCFGKLS